MHTAHCSSKTVLLLQMGIANRDIKLENTLLMDQSESPVLKLCDFGYSKDELCASISKTMCGEHSRQLTARWSATWTSTAMSSIACFNPAVLMSRAKSRHSTLQCSVIGLDMHDLVLCLTWCMLFACCNLAASLPQLLLQTTSASFVNAVVSACLVPTFASNA